MFVMRPVFAVYWSALLVLLGVPPPGWHVAAQQSGGDGSFAAFESPVEGQALLVGQHFEVKWTTTNTSYSGQPVILALQAADVAATAPPPPPPFNITGRLPSPSVFIHDKAGALTRQT
jgi:hypothetical protein